MNTITVKLCNDGSKLWLNDKNHHLWSNACGKIINYNYISNNSYNKLDKPVYAENNDIYWITHIDNKKN